MKLAQMSSKKKITLVVALMAVLWVSWYTVQVNSSTRVSRELRRMQPGVIEMLNDQGEAFQITVRIADTPELRRAGFTRNGVQTIEENVLLYVYAADTLERHNVQRVKAPLDMAFFRADGSLIQINRTRVNATTSYGPTGPGNRYRYVLVAPAGFFGRQGVSVRTDAQLLPDSLRR